MKNLFFASMLLLITIGMTKDVFGLPEKRTYKGEDIRNGIDDYQINEPIPCGQGISEYIKEEKVVYRAEDTAKDEPLFSHSANDSSSKRAFTTTQSHEGSKEKLMSQDEKLREIFMKAIGKCNKKDVMDVSEDIKEGGDEDAVTGKENESRVINDFRIIPHDHISLNAGYKMKE